MQPLDHAQGKPTGQRLEDNSNALLDRVRPASDLELLARTGFDVDLARIVPIEGRNQTEVAGDRCARRPRAGRSVGGVAGGGRESTRRPGISGGRRGMGRACV